MPKRSKSTDAQAAEARSQSVPAHLIREHWYLLRRVALQRSMKQGSRVTLSSVLNEVIESRRKELEKELTE